MKNSSLCNSFYIIIFCFFLTSISHLNAQHDNADKDSSKIKAVFIYNFIEFIQWPEEVSMDTIKIGIDVNEANEGLFAELKKMEANQAVSIYKIEQINSIIDMHMVYSNDVNMLSHINKYPVLLISDNEVGQNSSMIHFFNNDGRLKFDMNEALLKEHGLRYANR